MRTPKLKIEIIYNSKNKQTTKKIFDVKLTKLVYDLYAEAIKR